MIWIAIVPGVMFAVALAYVIHGLWKSGKAVREKLAAEFECPHSCEDQLCARYGCPHDPEWKGDMK